MMSFSAGDAMNVTAVSMCSHFGTHLDAPRHYLADGTAVDELPLDILVGPCRVVAYPDKNHIPARFIEKLDLAGITRLLIRTDNSRTLGRPEFREDYIALTPGAARVLIERRVELLGVDGYSIGPYETSQGMETHRVFLGAGPRQVAIEEVDLSGVEPGDYELIALPLRLTGLEGSPTRVLLGRP
jgi:arylformamidase